MGVYKPRHLQMNYVKPKCVFPLSRCQSVYCEYTSSLSNSSKSYPYFFLTKEVHLSNTRCVPVGLYSTWTRGVVRGPSVGWESRRKDTKQMDPTLAPRQGYWWGGGGRRPSRLEDPTSVGRLLSHTHTHTHSTDTPTHAHLQSLVLVTKVRNFTLDLRGCGTGGEEDGGSWEEKRGKDACMQNRVGRDIKSPRVTALWPRRRLGWSTRSPKVRADAQSEWSGDIRVRRPTWNSRSERDSVSQRHNFNTTLFNIEWLIGVGFHRRPRISFHVRHPCPGTSHRIRKNLPRNRRKKNFHGEKNGKKPSGGQQRRIPLQGGQKQ